MRVKGKNSNNNVIKTCLNRFLGRCGGCSRDYNGEHHPNNLDCPNYYEIKLLVVEVVEVLEKRKDS